MIRVDLPQLEADERAETAVGLAVALDAATARGPVVEAYRALAVALAAGRKSVDLTLSPAYAGKLPLLFRRVRNSGYGPPRAALDALEAAVTAATNGDPK